MAKPVSGAAVGFFDDPEELLKAGNSARARGFKNLDAYIPYPVHGINEALGIKRSWIPWATLGAGITGGSLAFLFMSWTSAVDWPLNVGGKPYISWPAFVPITFECTVLFAGLTTMFALWAACRLPQVNPKVLDLRITDDRFALVVPIAGSGVDEEKFLKETGALDVQRV
jgi:ActD protein